MVGYDGSGPETSISRKLAANGHMIRNKWFMIHSVETEVTATESPWQAGITEANGRAFKMVFKKMLDSTQPKDKREYE